MVLTGDNRRPRSARSLEGKTKIGAWWTKGNSEEAGAKPKRAAASSSSPGTTIPPPLRKSRSHDSRAAAGAIISPGAFSFLQSGILQKFGRQDEQQVEESPIDDDELYNLDIATALRPGGNGVNQGEAFSPAAYKNLQMKATGLLRRFQAAYRDQARTMRDMQAEQSAEKEELADVSTRAKHLQLQLEKTTQRAKEQEDNIMALLEQLTAEKKANNEYERIAKEKGIVLLTPNEPPTSVAESVAATEDLGVESDQRRRRWMRSVAEGERTVVEGEEADEAGDTDEESFEESSVFSRSMSPTTIAPSVSEGSIIAEGSQSPTPPTPTISSSSSSRPPSSISPKSQRVVMLTPPRGSRAGSRTRTSSSPLQSQSQQQGWGFQKLIKAVSGDVKTSPSRDFPAACSNCRGQDASVAWDTVSLLRYENMQLKESLSVKDTGIEEALHVIDRIQMR